MSNLDNLQKKVLSTTALKTNFISNTTQKHNPTEKRFSHISKEKQTQNQFKQTVQKNTARYYEEMDMQGSATILPQKNSSRKNIYMNQNSNLPLQVPSNQRKQLNQGLVLNNFKAKSPIDKTRIHNHSNNYSLLNNISNTTANHVTGPSANNISLANNFASNINNINMDQKIPIQSIMVPSSKLYPNKIAQALTDRQKSHRNPKQQHVKEQHIIKMKSMIFNNRKMSSQMDDLFCDQEIEMTLVPEKQHTRKLSNHLPIKNQSKTSLIKDLQNEPFSEQNYKTQKKHPMEKITLNLEKNKSQHNISIKQHNNNPLITNNMPLKSISHLMGNQNHSNSTNFQLTARHQKAQINIYNCEQQLRKFMHLQTQLDMNVEIEAIMRLQNRQKNYMAQPNYIECRQKYLTWSMRAVLMDWMVHVCYEFGLKRETYYIATALVDKYLQKTNDLPKSDFQLVGAASMFIAAKLQQFQALSSGEFSKSTDNRYSPLQIRQMELKICKCMNYELNPPTLYMWANRFMAHWDSYMQLTNAQYHPYFQFHQIKYFKKQSQQSYRLFREMMQFLDCSLLDVQTLQFAPKILVCSFMYLVLGKNYKEWPLKRIVDEFPRTSHYLLVEDEEDSFNNLFHMFIAQSFQLELIELLPAIQYCSTYFTLPLNFDSPSYALKNQSQDQSQLTIQQYESFQTYNGKTIDLIKKRYRGVYP